MKRFTSVLFAATIVAFAASCQKEIEQVVVPEGNGFTVLTAKTDNDLKTRTSLDGVSVVWTKDDKITAFDSEGVPHYPSTATELQNEAGTIVKFTVPTESPEYAVYPVVSQNMVDGQIPAKIPVSQNAKSGSFDNGANVAIAKVTDPDDIHFKNVGGLLAVKINATEHTITSIKISAEGTNMTGDILSSIDAEGNVNTSFSTAGDAEVADYVEITSSSGFEVGQTYYAVVAPGTYNNVTVVFTDDAGKTATYTKNSALVVERNSNQLIGGFSPDSRWIEEQQEVGPNYSWSLQSGDLGSNGEPASSVTKGNPELTWSLSYIWDLEEPSMYLGSDARGVQIGKGGDACTSLVLTASGYTGSIESIRLNFSHASSGGSSASVKVGNVDLTCEGEASVAGTTSAQNYLFTAEELVSGNVVITLSNSASKAMYLKSIEINPDTRTEQVLSFPQASYSAELSEGTFSSPVLTGAITSVTYSSADEEVATVSNTGLVTLKKVGSTTITAIAEATEQYQEGSASYELTITEGPISIADVINASVNTSVYTQGVVAQVNAKGVIITDGTNNLSVYQNATPSVSIGQLIKVTGKRDVYYNIPQISSPLITSVETGQQVARTPIITVTSSNATSFTTSQFVSLTGILTISGNYYNIAIEGSQTKGSLYQYAGDSLVDLDGTKVKVTGYVAGSSDSYLNIAEVSIESVPYLFYTEPEIANFTEGSQITIPVSANVEWTAAKGTDTDNIIKSVSYDEDEVTVTFNANSGNERSATVVLTPSSESGLTPVSVTVTQSKRGETPETLVYTLDGTVTGGNSGYDSESAIEQNTISWKVKGNTTTSPWRIGGKSLTNVDRTIYSTVPLNKNISKIEITHSGASSITVNSMTVIVASDAEFNSVVSSLTPSFVANGVVTVERPSGVNWNNCYFKIVYNVTVSSTSNKYIAFSKAEFTGK